MNSGNLYGVVLCGGISSRMGSDKSLLRYHGIEQRYHLYHVLTNFCSSTFLSCNHTQIPETVSVYEFMVDDERYTGNGPLTGLLTAFQRFPNKDILLVGCDYPFLDATEIKNFISSISDDAIAAAFYNQQLHIYEPVLAWYSHEAGIKLKRYFEEGRSSLQQFLNTIHAHKYLPLNPTSIRSIDTYEQFMQAAQQLRSKS